MSAKSLQFYVFININNDNTICEEVENKNIIDVDKMSVAVI